MPKHSPRAGRLVWTWTFTCALFAAGGVALATDTGNAARRAPDELWRLGVAQVSRGEFSAATKTITEIPQGLPLVDLRNFAPTQIDDRPLVMVVDDSTTVRRVMERFLERNGMRVVTAKDGLDGISLLRDCKPEIILLDIEMPHMDGYEFAAHVRNDERLSDIPIIMITFKVSDMHRSRAIEIGVNDYFGKPYQDAKLLDAISRLLEERVVAPQ